MTSRTVSARCSCHIRCSAPVVMTTSLIPSRPAITTACRPCSRPRNCPNALPPFCRSKTPTGSTRSNTWISAGNVTRRNWIAFNGSRQPRRGVGVRNGDSNTCHVPRRSGAVCRRNTPCRDTSDSARRTSAWNASRARDCSGCGGRRNVTSRLPSPFTTAEPRR